MQEQQRCSAGSGLVIRKQALEREPLRYSANRKQLYLEQRLLITPWNILIPIDADNTPVFLFYRALVLFCSVLVVLLGVQTAVLLDELKSKVHEAAMTAMVLVGVTVYQFLLTQGDELVCHDLVDALNCANCGECPTRSTLHWGMTTISID